MQANEVLANKYYRLCASSHTNLRGVKPGIFQSKASGSKIWDHDGKQYIDYTGGLGPNILGHCHPEYTHALKDYLDNKSTCPGSCLFLSEDDIDVASKLIQHIPCAETVKFSVTGTDAIQTAIRLARAYTKRPHFLKFGGHYHGWADNVLGGQPEVKPQGRPFGHYDSNDPLYTQGRGLGANQEGFIIPWNDFSALENTLRTYHKEIAIILLEGIVFNCCGLSPRSGFIARIRELCDQYGIIMCMDEVITGFRVGLSGAQGLLGVTPDMTTLGKAFGGGMPISALVGKEKFFAQLTDGSVLGPGTFNGLPLSMRAAKTTIEILERDGGSAYLVMANIQNILTQGLLEIANRRGIPMRIQEAVGGFFTLIGPDSKTPLYTVDDLSGVDFTRTQAFKEAMEEQGVLFLAGGRWYPSIVHDASDVEFVLAAADQVMAAL